MKKLQKIMTRTMVTAVFVGGGTQAYAQAVVAPSSVQLYGLVGLYISDGKRSGGQNRDTQLGHGGLATSYWGLKGSEDLGGGNRAIFALESFFRPTTGMHGRHDADPFFSRNAYVGLQGGLGTFTLGRQTNPTYSHMAMVSPFGGSTVFSPLVLQSFIAGYDGAIVGDTVWSKAAKYVVPRTNGFGGSIIYARGNDANDPSAANFGLHADYLKGPLTVVLSAQQVRTPVVRPMTKQHAYFAGIAYDFEVAKVYGSLGATTASGTTNRTRTYDLGVSVPVSKQGKILAEWARTKREHAENVSTTRNTASLGYDHSLSKRTDVYGIYSYDKLSGFGSGSTFAVGIRHQF